MMANQEYVELLRQGMEQWNRWRKQNPGIEPDLSEADLKGVELGGSNRNSINLIRAYLTKADLSGADLSYANLREASLGGINLSGADLTRAELGGAYMGTGNLSHANLSMAELSGTDFNHAKLSKADLSFAHMGGTIFANVDLRETKGLIKVVHQGPSHIQLYTVLLPQDGSALHFLRGAGIPDEWIDFWRTTMMHPVQYHSLFISYSSKDETLARRLHADLQDQGVRCWFAPEDMKIGDRFHARINEAIHMQDKLLLLLSKHAIQSDWVEIEVRAALEKEHRQNRDVLFPVCLDSSVMDTSQAWAAMLRQSRHIGDFTNWTDLQAYQIAFDRLLRDLKKADERQDPETKQ